jgi:protease I
MSRKVLLVTGDGGNSFEALYAYQRFLEERWEPVIAAPSRRRLHLIQHDFEPGWETYIERPGVPMDADVAITAVSAREFSAMIVLGGRAPEYLRNDASMLSLVREFVKHDKWVCAIGHGIQVLIAADVIRGRSVTCHPHVCIEVERGGATYVKKPAVRDGKFITAANWDAQPEFYRELFSCLGKPAT